MGKTTQIVGRRHFEDGEMSAVTKKSKINANEMEVNTVQVTGASVLEGGLEPL